MKRSEIKRTPMKSRNKPKSAGDFSLSVKELVYDRDNGRCFRCGIGIAWGEGNIQHRQARGAGGSKYDYRKSLPSNGILLCFDCHDWVENRDRQNAKDHGWVVLQGIDPSTVRVLRYTGWVYLRIDGTIIQAADVDV